MDVPGDKHTFPVILETAAFVMVAVASTEQFCDSQIENSPHVPLSVVMVEVESVVMVEVDIVVVVKVESVVMVGVEIVSSEHKHKLILFLSRVTAPFCARRRPSTDAPVLTVMDTVATRTPTNFVLTPIVADDPTCQ